MMIMMISRVFSYRGFTYSYILRSYFGCIIIIIITILIVTTITGPLPTVYKWCQQTISGLPVFTPLHFSADSNTNTNTNSNSNTNTNANTCVYTYTLFCSQDSNTNTNDCVYSSTLLHKNTVILSCKMCTIWVEFCVFLVM